MSSWAKVLLVFFSIWNYSISHGIHRAFLIEDDYIAIFVSRTCTLQYFSCVTLKSPPFSLLNEWLITDNRSIEMQGQGLTSIIIKCYLMKQDFWQTPDEEICWSCLWSAETFNRMPWLMGDTVTDLGRISTTPPRVKHDKSTAGELILIAGFYIRKGPNRPREFCLTHPPGDNVTKKLTNTKCHRTLR